MTTEEFYSDETAALHVNDDFAKVRQQGYSVELGDTISKGWDFMKPQLGSLIGFLVIAVIIVVILSMILGLIPYIGSILNGAINAIVLAGFYYFFIKLYQDKYATFSDFFESFQDAVPLGLSGLLISLFTYVPFILLGLIGFFAFDLANVNFSDPNEIIQMMQGGTMSILFLIAIIPMVIISTLYTFTAVIIATNKSGAWDAMESSRKLVMANFGGVFGFIWVLGLINAAGALLCGLGLFVTVPLTYASIFILYTKLVEKNGAGEFFYGDEKAPLDAI
ncbi:hypothetical protein [Bernardetia sp. MNP-M8]|uniref:hypothetical protein n=1 Tax=Bernardetia sp. MNP-M8 TaxID=3127470 RepID=UPI0030D1C4E2